MLGDLNGFDWQNHTLHPGDKIKLPVLEFDKNGNIVGHKTKSDNNTTSSVGGWSSWSTSYVSGLQNDAQLREVQTNWVAPTYKTQYHYFTYYKGSSAPWTHYSSSHPYFAEIWVDSQLPFYKYSGGINQYGGSGYNFGYSFNRWLICDGTTY